MAEDQLASVGSQWQSTRLQALAVNGRGPACKALMARDAFPPHSHPVWLGRPSLAQLQPRGNLFRIGVTEACAPPLKLNLSILLWLVTLYLSILLRLVWGGVRLTVWQGAPACGCVWLLGEASPLTLRHRSPSLPAVSPLSPGCLSLSACLRLTPWVC
jgi:hypothetical protein